MKQIKILDRCVVCENKEKPFSYFGWPTVARLPDATLAAVCSGFRVAHICPYGKAVICYSKDEGKSWTKPEPVIDTPLDDRDAGITAFGDNCVIVTSFNNTVDFQREINRKNTGELHDQTEAHLDSVACTDAEDKYLGSTYRISHDGGKTYGEIMRIPVTCPHGPIALPDGDLFYVGCVFAKEEICGGTPTIQCYRIKPDGRYSYVSSIENAGDAFGPLYACEPHAILLPDGKIIVQIRMQRTGEHRVFTIYQSESYDMGKSFTKPHAVLSENGGSPPHLIRHSGGTLISVYGYRQPPYGIRVMFCDDNGETWDTDNILTDDAYSWDLGYPASVELKDGSILTVFYEHLTDGNASPIMQVIWKME